MSYRRFIWKNSLRNKRRTLLTVLSVALAVVVLAVLMTFVDQLDELLRQSSPLRMLSRHAVSLGTPLPLRYRGQIERLPGVVAVTPINFFDGIYIDESHTDFGTASCDPKTLFDVHTDITIPAEQKQAFMQERTAAIVGRLKADQHGWKLGDRITLKGVQNPVSLELTIRGIFKGSNSQESFVIFNHDYLEEATNRPGAVSAYWIKADSAGSVPGIIQTIDEMFNNTDAPTKTETERAFSLGIISMLGNLNVLITAITCTIIFAILLVTANTMAMSVRERTREIAVLKSLGFRRARIMRLLIGEGMLITITGGLIGSVLARFGFGSVNLALYTEGLVQNLEVGWPIIGFGVLVSALLGLISAGIPAYRAVRMLVADGLRHIG